MQADSNLRVNGDRLWDSLMEMAKIGATAKGGVKRLTLTDLDRESRDLFAKWGAEAGCTLTVDQMGTMFLRRPGTDDTLAPVMIGSHLDSQPTGGKFDGALGVMAGLEVVRTLKDLDIKTKHPIEIVNFTNEEGSRFAPAMVASGVTAGVFDLEWAYSRQDETGVTLGDELERIGYKGEADVSGRPFHAFLEVHIEQGPYLEEDGIDIGVVTLANGQTWYEITVEGFESHAGPTPMTRRRDALLGAAGIIEKVNAIGMAHQPGGCATVGMIEASPNSRNVIPGKVFLTVDFRHPDPAELAAMAAELEVAVPDICAGRKVTASLEKIFDFAPLHFDARCVAAVRGAAEKLGYSHKDMTSGAGHDAVHMGMVGPAAMIFTPCVDGISHNEAEDMTKEWAEAGGSVLLHAALELAEVVAD
jgi:N-carbamoyl-L-amino-acid hydrolase